MNKGWLVMWRRQMLNDLALPALQFKVLMFLMCTAMHTKSRKLNPGQMRVSNSDIREALQEDNGKRPSEQGVWDALEALEKKKYIKCEATPGVKMKITVLDWSSSQSKRGKGYEYIKKGHELPPSTDDSLLQ